MIELRNENDLNVYLNLKEKPESIFNYEFKQL